MLREETDSQVMKFAAKAWRKLFCREQWFIELELPAAGGVLPAMGASTSIYPPPDRFWADPFIVSTTTGHCVFVEELPYATGKGHIAVLELDRDGTLLDSRKVLERPYHLSYPFVFEWKGSLYMLPESGQNRTVELYRCVAFPDQWVLDRVLLWDVRAADATLVKHEGWWWMFMTQETPGRSIHEDLYLYRAETPLGPYEPHSGNPVKTGMRGTRPAGALFAKEGVLHRPAQDCSRVYGEAIVLQRVDELSLNAFRETELCCIKANPKSEGRRRHTLNTGFEIRVMDALRWIPRSIF